MLKNPKHVILRTDNWVLTLGTNQYYLGRAFLSVLKHRPSLESLSNEEWTDFIGIVKKIEKVYKKAFGADLVNWSCLMNNAYQNNPPDPHVHWHVVPRYSQVKNFAGDTFTDGRYGHSSRDNEYIKEVSAKIMEEITQQLRSELSS